MKNRHLKKAALGPCDHFRPAVRGTIVTNYLGFDVTALAGLAGASLLTNGAWGGFYFWKAKNENRAKYAQRFLKQFADKYGADVAVRVAEIVLKD